MKQQTSNPEESGTIEEPKKKSPRISARDIAYVGLMVAVIEVCKAALSGLPNVELTSFWIVMFTICFGWRIIVIVPVFILIEGMIYGVHVWWIMYLYVWPLLAFLAWIFRKREEPLFWAVLSGAFGLSFGYLCSLVYLVMGLTQNGFQDALHTQMAWWVAGIPYDLVHCAGNFVFMLLLFKPIKKAIKKVAITPEL